MFQDFLGLDAIGDCFAEERGNTGETSIKFLEKLKMGLQTHPEDMENMGHRGHSSGFIEPILTEVICRDAWHRLQCFCHFPCDKILYEHFFDFSPLCVFKCLFKELA